MRFYKLRPFILFLSFQHKCSVLYINNIHFSPVWIRICSVKWVGITYPFSKLFGKDLVVLPFSYSALPFTADTHNNAICGSYDVNDLF